MHFYFLVSHHFKLSERITLVFEKKKKNFEPFQHSYRCGQNINKVAREGVCSELPHTKRKSKSLQYTVVPGGFPFNCFVWLRWSDENRHVQHGTASFRRPLRDEKRGRYSFIYFWHYSEQWKGDGTKSWKEAKNTVSIPLAFVQYTAARKRVCLHSHFVMATPDWHRQMHRRTFWRSTGGKVVTRVHPML